MTSPTRVLVAGLLGLLLTSAMPLPAQEEGSVRLRLGRDTVLAGVSCGPTGRAYAVLHANGRLDECPVARDTVIAGHALPRGTWLRLTDTGLLDGAWLPTDTELQGVPCKGMGYKKWSVRFHPSGRLSLCFPAHDAVVQGVPCLGAGFWREVTGGPTAVALDAAGRLTACRLSRDITVEGVAYRRGARFTRVPRATTSPSAS